MSKNKSRRPAGLPPVGRPNPLAAKAPAPVEDPTPAPRPDEFDPELEEEGLEDVSVSPSLGTVEDGTGHDHSESEGDGELDEELGEEPGNEPPLDGDAESSEEKSSEKEEKTETGLEPVNNLGNPREPEFNPRDSSRGFYQGVDPSTGERIYSPLK
jgi:hypothetical protein